jgi:hypothetical protein
VAVIASALAAAPAHAQDLPRVSIDSDCATVDGELLLQVVRVELGSAVVTGDTAADQVSLTRVTARCEGDQVRLRVDDPITGKALERTIEMGGIGDGEPAVRARVLGLAIVELVAASWIELELRPPEPARDTGARPAPRRSEDAAIAVVRRRMEVHRRPPTLLFDALLGERRHQHELSMRTAELRGSYRLGWLSLGLAGAGGAGERPVSSGSIEVQLWTVGAHAAVEANLDRLQLQTGLGASAGRARLRGRSTIGADEMSFTAPVATVHGRFTARARATERWSLHLTVEAGAVLAGVDAVVPTHTERVYRGTFVGLATGIGVAF